MTFDPNWLLATLAQSSAALVAIVGGFLVSRVIALLGVREELQREIAQHEATIEGFLAARDKTRSDRAWHYITRVADDWGPVLFPIFDDPEQAGGPRTTPGAIGIVDHLENHLGYDFDDEEREAALAVILRWGRAQQALAPYWADLDSETPTLEKLTEEGEVDVPAEWGWLWEHVANELDADRSRRHRTAQRALEDSLGMSGILTQLITQQPRVAATFNVPALSGVPWAEYRKELEYLDREQSLVEVQLEAAHDQLDQLRTPPAARRALWALAYMTVVGVVAPVGVMAAGPTELPLWAQTGLVLLFISGLGALGRFLWRAMDEVDQAGDS